MAGDGSLFDGIFAAAVEPTHVKLFQTSLDVVYSSPRDYPDPMPTPLSHIRISSETQEVVQSEFGEEIHYVRFLIAIVENGDPNFCGITNFLKDGTVTIESTQYAVVNVSRHSVDAQHVKLKKYGYQSVGVPDGGTQ